MKQFFAQFLKEFMSYFNGFTFYVIFILYNILSYFLTFYAGDYFLRETEIFNAYFSTQPLVLIFIIPSITMHLWAEEIKSGTIELLLTQPISFLKLTLAKFFAAYMIFVILVSSSFFIYVFTNALVLTDRNATFMGYIGLFLTGGLFIAIGAVCSISSKNNIISYILASFTLLIISQLHFEPSTFNSYSLLTRGLDFENNYQPFLTGLISFSNIFYFLFGIFILLWINCCIILLRCTNSLLEKKYFILLVLILFFCFILGNMGVFGAYPRAYDLTDNKIYSLRPENEAYLNGIDKRINITLYESSYASKNTNSAFEVYAQYIKRYLNGISRASNGAIRIDLVLVEPFSQLEQLLINDRDVYYEEDALGYKTYLAADFSDNLGNNYLIKNFNSLRQHLLETDIMRVIRKFNKPVSRIGVVMDKNNQATKQGMLNTLKEFYDTQIFSTPLKYIPNELAALIITNPERYTQIELLALDQYILNGGSVIIFASPQDLIYQNNNHFSEFLFNFGFDIKSFDIIKQQINNSMTTTFDATVKANTISRDEYHFFVDNAGEFAFIPDKSYLTYPLLTSENKIIGGVSKGTYLSLFADFSLEYENDLDVLSRKKGQIYFIYSIDMLNDDLFISKESKNYSFYQLISYSDTIPFLLNLISDAVYDDTEKQLGLPTFIDTNSSIGATILSNIQSQYKTDLEKYQNEITHYDELRNDYYQKVEAHEIFSLKDVGNINKIEQAYEKAQTELQALQADILETYQFFIMLITICFVFIMPILVALLIFIGVFYYHSHKLSKIRGIINNVSAN